MIGQPIQQIDLQDGILRLQGRLPELELQVSKFGAFFPLHLLPAGLFREVSSGSDCVADIARDLQGITAHTPECVLQYWSTRLSQKIHVLVHICRTHRPHPRTNHHFDTMGTRAQWLEHTALKRNKLSHQRLALLTTLHRMQQDEDEAGLQVLKKNLQDLEAQILDLG